MRRLAQLAILAVMSIMVLACSTVDGSLDDRKIANILFQDSETVYFADGALFRGRGRFSNFPSNIKASLEFPFSMLLAALKNEALNPLYGPILEANTTRSLTLGARRFHFGDGLGPVLFDACFVIRTTQGALDLKTLLRLRPVGESKGKPLWTITFPYGGDRPQPTTFFIVQPTSDSVLMGTALYWVESVQQKLSDESAISKGISGPYEDLDLARAPVWGYRNYRSVYRGQFRDFIEDLTVPPSAVGLAFFLQPSAEKVQLRYLSSPDDDTANRFTGFRFSEIRPGTWDATVPLSDPEVEVELFSAFWLLGFGVVI